MHPVDDPYLILMVGNSQFECPRKLKLPRVTGTAAVHVKDGTWNLKFFKKLRHDGWAAKKDGPDVSVSGRMIVLDWYASIQVGLLCYKGHWYEQLLRYD